ncbi:ubiquitin carboxyl-terminal hydrolase [Acrasis kona]|uniref:Ubiquitin carboxyl-terminal hydrolase n=1 Tax=Acrasis kona TaxID=1008807 RepID=A0AAW2YL51_9EUKA
MKSNRHNIVDTCFKSVLSSSIICGHCKNVSKVNEDCHDLSVPIPSVVSTATLQERVAEFYNREMESYRSHKSEMLNPDKILEQINFDKRDENDENEVTLMHCMWAFTAKEVLSGENGYNCEKCSHLDQEEGKRVLRDATKQLSIQKPAKVLTIHLKRFGHQLYSGKNSLLAHLMQSGGGLRKNSTQVTFPKSLELGSFIHPSSPWKNTMCKYRLFGVVEHQGTMNSGYYISFVKQLQVNKNGEHRRGEWYRISDSHAALSSQLEVLEGSQPYLLMYELVE